MKRWKMIPGAPWNPRGVMNYVRGSAPLPVTDELILCEPGNCRWREYDPFNPAWPIPFNPGAHGECYEIEGLE